MGVDVAASAQAIFDKRRAGILLHPTSLPGGVVGSDAYYFVDWLVKAGISVWQMLPLGPVHQDKSPYQCLSAHAGNPTLISDQYLIDRGWLPVDENSEKPSIERAFEAWLSSDGKVDSEFTDFVAQHDDWLHDYALFVVIREQQNNAGWFHWPEKLRDRDKRTLAAFEKKAHKQLLFVKFEQYVFYYQW